MTLRRSALLFALALFAAALALRLWAAFHWQGAPAWDGHYYDIGATSIAAGRGYAGESGKPWCHYPVGYSALVGAAYWLFGARPIVATVLGAFTGAGLAALVYLLALPLGEARARVAGVLAAVYPGLVVYSALVMTEPAGALFLVAAAAVAARYQASPRASVAAGLLLGLGTLVRPQSLLLAPFLGLFAPARRLRAAAIATVVALAVVSPWTVRNCLVMDGCAFVSTNAGWNLAIGAFPRATGRFETLHADDGCHDVTGQVNQDRCWMRLGADHIAADPRRWLALVPKKLGFTFDHESFPIGYLAAMDEARWPERDRAVGRAVLTWSHRALLVAAAFGVLARPSRRRPASLLAPFALGLIAWYAATTPEHPFWLVALALCVAAAVRWRHLGPAERFAAAAIGSLFVIHGVFFGEDRYHLVVTPFLCLLAVRREASGAASREAPGAASREAPGAASREASATAPLPTPPG